MKSAQWVLQKPGGDKNMTHVAGGGGRKQWNKELVWLKSHGQGKGMNKYRKNCSPDSLRSLIKSDRMYLFCGLLF